MKRRGHLKGVSGAGVWMSISGKWGFKLKKFSGQQRYKVGAVSPAKGKDGWGNDLEGFGCE